MFKNALLYRIEHWDAPALPQIEERLAAQPFVECGASQPESTGWVPPRGEAHGALIESVGGQLIVRQCSETKAVPGGVIKTQLEGRLAKIEQETGRRPRGKIVKELKEELVHALLPRAFPKRSETVVWIDPQAQWLLVGSSSMKKADALLTRLLDALGGGCRLAPLQTALSPATAMAGWLVEQEAPAGFSIDRECELKQPQDVSGEKATVRYARHTLEIAEVGEHIRQGKLPTQLALTWAGRVSFVLAESLALKKIKLLDGVLEGQGTADDGGFDADVALFTGELRQLLPELLAALGGVQQAAAPAAPVTPLPAASADPTVAPWDVAPA